MWVQCFGGLGWGDDGVESHLEGLLDILPHIVIAGHGGARRPANASTRGERWLAKRGQAVDARAARKGFERLLLVWGFRA